MKITLMTCVFLLICGCVPVAGAPSVAVMPAPGKPFDLFTAEEQTCRSWAEHQVGISPQEASQNTAISGAALGTALGAAAGTAVGAVGGNVGAGAVAGAGLGLMEGTAIGSASAWQTNSVLQQRYNVAYEQCMYAKGNQIQGFPAVYAPPAMPPPPPPGPYGQKY